MTLTDSQLEELYDSKLLHDNLMKYCRAADRKDIEGMRDTYWPDSIDDHGQYVGSGSGWADANEYWKKGQMAGNHHITNVLCEIDGNLAKRESMFLVVSILPEPDVTLFIGGRYRDLCEKRNGEWKVRYRTCIWDWGDVRKLRPNWALSKLPDKTHWGALYPDDPIYKDWSVSDPTVRPPHQDPVQ
jgi:hypothetical protein